MEIVVFFPEDEKLEICLCFAFWKTNTGNWKK